MPGSHITIPRDEFKIMRNSALAQNPNGNGDTNLDVGTYSTQKSRNYSTPYGTAGNMQGFWNENKPMVGDKISPVVDVLSRRNA